MTEEEKTVAEKTSESLDAVLAIADRDEEIESLKRHLVFSIGISVGLLVALHLILRSEM